MKPLLIAAIIGYGCWLISDLIELLTGEYGSPVVYLTALFHLFGGVGIWGLCLALSPERRPLALISTSLVSIGHLGLAPLPLHVHWAGQGLMLILGEHSIYVLLLLGWSIGILAFSVSVIRSPRVPTWIGWCMLIGFAMIIASRPMNWPTPFINLTTIGLCLVMIRFAAETWRTSDSRPLSSIL
jgi:hypothetical protein